MHSDTSFPIVSFVVPVYNVASYVRRCLISILGQSVRNIEVIVVNDGSTDGSGAICDEVAGLDSRVIIIHTSNCGVSHARNTGLNRVRGTYVCFIDSDDWLSPVFAERMISMMEKNGVEVVACGPTRVDSKGAVLWRHSKRHLILETEDALCGVLRRDLYCGWPWNKMFSHRLLVENGIQFDENLRYCEDMVFCFDAIRHTSRVAYDSSSDLYFYRESETSANKHTITNGMFNLCYLNRLEADQQISKRAKTISARLFRYAKANAFISNESIYRKLCMSRVPQRNILSLVAVNMVRNLPFVLLCHGFGSVQTKCRYIFETFRALFLAESNHSHLKNE